MSFFEYEARMHTFKLRQVDDDYEMHRRAWLNHQVTLTKEQGNKQVPIYKEFKDFFDYEKQLKEIDKQNNKGLSPKHKKMAEIAKKANERR